MNKLEIGSTAPNFTITTSDEKSFTLENAKDSYVLLYFYPKDNTPGCTSQAKGFSNLIEEFEKFNVKIIGVSKDNLASHQKFIEKYDLKFLLGSDLDGQVCEKYGVWKEKSMFGKKYMGIARTTFLIGPDQKIIKIWEKVSVLSHGSEILKYVTSLN